MSAPVLREGIPECVSCQWSVSMIELLISACALTSEPAGHTPPCREFSLLFDAREVSLMTCMLHGQAQIAQWKERHEGWGVERWQCRPRDMRESRI
jgi:hypothetical protein